MTSLTAVPLSLVELLRASGNVDPLRQAIALKRSSFDRYGSTFHPVFQGAGTLVLSRADVFAAFRQAPTLGALTAIAWGFPRGGLPGGRSLRHALDALPLILERIGPGAVLDAETFQAINSHHYVKNGITTKLLHFSGILTREGHRAQIYDSRIHKYLTLARPREYAPLIATLSKSQRIPTPAQYLEYLRLTEQVAREAGHDDPSRAEMFMFSNAPGTRQARHRVMP